MLVIRLMSGAIENIEQHSNGTLQLNLLRRVKTINLFFYITKTVLGNTLETPETIKAITKPQTIQSS